MRWVHSKVERLRGAGSSAYKVHDERDYRKDKQDMDEPARHVEYANAQ
jgi:hypothetical protein